MPRRKPAPIHPGEILLEEFLAPLGISQYRLARTSAFPHDESMRSFEDNVDYGGYRSSIGTFFPNDGEVLAQPADSLRPGIGKGPTRGSPRS